MSNLTDQQLLEAAKFMKERGISLTASLHIPQGWAEHRLSADEAVAFARDPIGVQAKHCGVTREQYLAWEQAEYRIQCAAKTKSGRRCQNVVRRGEGVGAAEWVRRQGSYCHVHGGE